MIKQITLLFLLAFVVSCAPTIQTLETERTKIVLTNLIDEVKIIGEGNFVDRSKNVTISARPIDVRQFDRELSLNNYFGGEHKSVLASINEVKIEDRESFSEEYELLVSKLLDEGLSSRDIRSITEIVIGDKEANDQLYVYSDPNIYLTSYYQINETNPFAVGGRYLTLLELKMVNNSDEIQKVCENEFVFTSNDFSYSSIPASEILSNIPSSSVRYELLHKLLIKECEVLPENSTVTAYLVFPSFYDKEELSLHYINDNQTLKEGFTIQRNRVVNQYPFTKIRVAGIRTRGYRIITGSEPANLAENTASSGRSYHFIKMGNSINYVGYKEFLIHDDIDLETVEIFNVRYKDSENIEILKSPISRQNISDGLIEVEN